MARSPGGTLNASRLVAAALALTALAAPVARAQSEESSWDDPSLEDALEHAKLVARGHADPKSKPDAPAIVVDQVIAGEGAAGATIALANASNAIAEKFIGL